MRIVPWASGIASGLALAGLLGIVSPGAAGAASLDVNGWTLGEQVYVQSAGRTGWVYTAELDVTLGGYDGFSYCVDLAQSIGAGVTSGWATLSPEIDEGILRAAWLVEYVRPQFDVILSPDGDFAAAGVTRATAIAALQVAIWEVVADDPGGYDLLSGAFALRTGGASAGVLLLAREFLDQLETRGIDEFQTLGIWAQHATRQDQIVFAPIPEPSSWLLFAAGAGVLAVAGRRGYLATGAGAAS